jgi:hypothetical protein
VKLGLKEYQGTVARFHHTAALLAGGMVLVAGGSGSRGIIASAELYDPATGTWTNTGNLVIPRAQHSATLLPNGMLLAVGGEGGGSPTGSSEVYDPASATWTETGDLVTARAAQTGTLLLDGRVLVAAGYTGLMYQGPEQDPLCCPVEQPLASAELGGAPSPTPTPTSTPTATTTATSTPTATPTPGPITLSATKRMVAGINTVRLTWSGATSTNIDVYRNGVLIVTTANDGSFADSTGDTGGASYTYHVSEAGTTTCSNDVTVRFRQ